MAYILSISMFTQKFIKIFHSVQEIGLFSLFQNLALGYHLTISWATSCPNINVYAKFHHNIPLRTVFHFFQNLELGKASTDEKCHFAISWTRCRQYQCVCKILSKYSKRFKSYLHFSRTGRWQNLHKLSGDKIKCLIIGHTMKVNRQFQLTFLGSFNLVCQ